MNFWKTEKGAAMRLIDAEQLIRNLQTKLDDRTLADLGVYNMIRSEPTAYDLDALKARMEEKEEEIKKRTENDYRNGMEIGIACARTLVDKEKWEKEENRIATWIIRYEDNYLRSHYGTKKEAEAIAKEQCVLHGGDYIIA